MWLNTGLSRKMTKIGSTLFSFTPKTGIAYPKMSVFSVFDYSIFVQLFFGIFTSFQKAHKSPQKLNTLANLFPSMDFVTPSSL